MPDDKYSLPSTRRERYDVAKTAVTLLSRLGERSEMTRKVWLAGIVAVGLAVALLPSAASAQGEPERPAPESLRAQDMTNAELQQRLAEWEAGKRDDRDGYIILNQIWFNHQLRKTTNTPEYQAVTKRREALLKKRPELNGLQDFRLKDKIQADRKQHEDAEKATAARKSAKPADKAVVRLVGDNQRVVAVYQYRLEFLALPDDVKLDHGSGADRLKLKRGEQVVQPEGLPAAKKMTFQNPIEVLPSPEDRATRILVCTNPVGYYSPRTQDELAIFGYGVKWENSAGQHADYCGVLALDGTEVYRFPAPQAPGQLLRPVGISEDGQRAEVMVGKKVTTPAGEDDDQPGEEIDAPSEILRWGHPNRLERTRLKGGSWSQLRQDFRRKDSAKPR